MTASDKICMVLFYSAEMLLLSVGRNLILDLLITSRDLHYLLTLPYESPNLARGKGFVLTNQQSMERSVNQQKGRSPA